MRYLSVFLLLTLFIGCQHTQSPPAIGLNFTTDAVQYAPGSTVQLQLNNQTAETIGYNLCFSDLEQQTDQGWESVEDSDTVCTTIQHGLMPGKKATYEKALMSDLPDGTYRFMTEVEHRDASRQETLVTNVFTVGS